MSNGTVRTTCGNGRVEPTRQASVRDKDAVNSNYVRSLAQDARRWVFRPVPTCSLPPGGSDGSSRPSVCWHSKHLCRGLKRRMHIL
jgi:hypothetical protein